MAESGEFRIRGHVATGLGLAVSFTGVDWARQGFIRLVGIDPYPGTLNLKIREEDSLAAWAALRGMPGHHLPAPDADSCDARLYLVTLGRGITGAIVLPEVAGYPADQVEIIAAVHLRKALSLADDDVIIIKASAI
jgi:CTP-dependent riboflavin kinase